MENFNVGLEECISMALKSGSFATLMKAGGGILLIGLLARLLLEWHKFFQGGRADWSGPIIAVMMTMLALAAYPIIIKMVVSFVATFGDVDKQGEVASKVFQERVDKVFAAMESTKGWFDGVKAYILWGLLWIVKAITLALIYAVKAVQAFTIRTLVMLGPVMIALGIVPGPFKNLPMNWFMMLFTTAFWSVIMSSLLSMLAATTSTAHNDGVNFTGELVTSLVWINLILTVPAIAVALIQGGGFNGVIKEGVSMATGNVAAAAKAFWPKPKGGNSGK